MKISTVVLTGSLAVNVTFAALFLFGGSDELTPAPSSALTAPVVSAAVGTSSAGTDAWAVLKSDELATQRDRLRAEGFPPSTIRAILASQVRESFAARRKALEAAQGDLPFWKNPTADPQTQAELRALSKLEQQALKDLLGPDPDNSTVASLRRQLAGFAPEKIDELAAIRDRYNEQRQAIYADMSASSSPEYRQKIVDLDKALHAEIASVLTPQELEDYDLRTSNTANQLRNNLVAFDATEAEFRALYKLQSAFEERFNISSIVGLPSDQQSALLRQRSDAQKQLGEEIKGALGDGRYVEYQRATDYSYRQTTQLVARLDLPVETANQVYTVQQDIQQRVRTLQTDRNLTPADRTAQLAGLAAEAEAKITSSLGPRGYEAYKQVGGQWLQQLQPRPVPSAPAPKL